MTAIVELSGVAKSFGSLQALKPLTVSIRPAEVVGLIGENGAGKSTLIKLLSGLHLPDQGVIRFAGHQVDFGSPREAMKAGIATIHQELEFVPHLSVAENMLLGEQWPRHPWGAVHWRQL